MANREPMYFDEDEEKGLARARTETERRLDELERRMDRLEAGEREWLKKMEDLVERFGEHVAKMTEAYDHYKQVGDYLQRLRGVGGDGQ